MQDSCKFIANINNRCYHSINEEGACVLIEYRVKNFMSYKDEIVLSMVADTNRELAETNVFQQGNMTLLKTAAIFGANASGKSNLIASFKFLIHLMHSKADASDPFSDLPLFKLNPAYRKKPIEYEISFFLGSQRYRYGLELDEEGICSEWLYFVPKRQEACYFVRTRDEITTIGTYFGEKKALDYIKPDSYRPFLFTLGQKSVKEFEWAKKVLRYLRFYIRTNSAPDMYYNNMIQKELTDHKPNKTILKEELVSILKNADIGINDISVVKEIRNADEKEMFNRMLNLLETDIEIEIDEEKYETFMHHNMYDDDRNLVGEEKFPLEVESAGTVKLYSLQYPILQVLKKGGILLVDEIESSLHPLLCEKIVSLFNSDETNPNRAQLIFTTHNTLLMNSKLLRRDQILFTEKDKYGASTLYTLYDIDLKVRNNFNYLNNYLSGRFGAIPYLGTFNINTEHLEVLADEK